MEQYMPQQIYNGVCKQDIDCINSDIIAKQPNGNYCKFCAAINAVIIKNMSFSAYVNYWTGLYRYRSQEEYDLIYKTCIDKLTTGLIEKSKMIELIKNSKDVDSEKTDAIKYLRGQKR